MLTSAEANLVMPLHLSPAASCHEQPFFEKNCPPLGGVILWTLASIPRGAPAAVEPLGKVCRLRVCADRRGRLRRLSSRAHLGGASLPGVNDVSLYGARSIPRVAGYVQAMAREARQRGADVIICTEPPQRAGGFRAADPGVISAYNQALRDLAAAEGAQLVDFEATVDLSLIGADGLHPTEAGYGRMAEVLFDAIRQRYELAP
jgi:hypothetical protein